MRSVWRRASGMAAIRMSEGAREWALPLGEPLGKGQERGHLLVRVSP